MFLVEIRNICVCQTGITIIFSIAAVENSFNVKYLEKGDRYDVDLDIGRIGKWP